MLYLQAHQSQNNHCTSVSYGIELANEIYLHFLLLLGEGGKEEQDGCQKGGRRVPKELLN